MIKLVRKLLRIYFAFEERFECFQYRVFLHDFHEITMPPNIIGKKHNHLFFDSIIIISIVVLVNIKSIYSSLRRISNISCVIKIIFI